MLLNAAKFQGYNFDRFRVIKRKTLEWGKVTPPPPANTEIRDNLKEKL